MAKKQIPAPLIEKPREFIPEPKLRFQKTKNIEHIATTLDSSFINLRTKRAGVFVYIRPSSENIDKILKQGTDKKDYRFERIDSENLRGKFLEATMCIKSLNYSSLGPEVHIYLYSISNKRRIYNITKALYTKHTF